MIDHPPFFFLYIHIEGITRTIVFMLISKDNHKKIERKSKVTFSRRNDIPLEKMNIF